MIFDRFIPEKNIEHMLSRTTDGKKWGRAVIRTSFNEMGLKRSEMRKGEIGAVIFSKKPFECVKIR